MKCNFVSSLGYEERFQEPYILGGHSHAILIKVTSTKMPSLQHTWENSSIQYISYS